MATLRDPLFGLNNAPTAEWQAAEIEAQRPNSLRGGWESGRIGTDINALNADISSLRASGDSARADGLQREAEALRQQQARVAPQIGRLEDIHGVGDALSWAAGQVGQGAAPMVEPLAAATSIGGVGALMGMAPGGIGAAGRALRNFGAPAAAFGINQRQLKGEFYGEASQDPELMARTSPQDLNNTAELYGVGAGALDTVLPHIVGRQLTGAGLRKGLDGMGIGAKTLMGMGAEGATEAAQNYGSQQTQGYLNPNRETSGDMMENVNAFAGGAIGGGPISAAGAMADAGYRRTGVTADQIGAKTGEMVDLARERYEGSALQSGVDTAVDGMGKALAAGKQKAGDLMDLARDDEGNISLTRLAEAAGEARDSVQGGAQDLVQRYKVSAEERDILDAVPPQGLEQDPEKYAAWFAETSGKRTNFVAQRLDEMAESDPAAADLFDRLVGETDPAAQQAVAEEGASYILQNNEIEQLQTRAERAAAAAGEFAMKGAGAVGKGAVAAGKAAAKFGKAVFDGAAGEMRKQNKQGEGPAAQGYAAWLERTDRAITDRAARDGLAPPDAAQARSRGDLFGEMLATETQAALSQRGFDSQRMSKVTGLVRDVGYDIAHLTSKGGPQGPGAALTVGRLANTLRTAMGPRAESMVDELQALAGPKAPKMFDQLKQEVAAGRGFTGRQQAAQVRTAAANQLVAMLPPQDMQEILRSEAGGSKLNRAWLLDTIEGVANGHESPQMRKALNEKFGQETVAKMLELVGGTLPAPNAKYGDVDGGNDSLIAATVNEDGEYAGETTAEGMTDFEQRQAEKKVAKGTGPKVYGFARTKGQSLRGSTDRRDPFAPVAKMTQKEKLAVEDENLQRAAEGLEPLAGAPITRPGLFKLTDTLFIGNENALQKKIADMEKSLEAAGGHAVGARSALEVMQDLDFQPAKILSVYRDYLRQDAAGTKLTDAERKPLKAQANLANRAVMDAMDQGAGKTGKTAFRLSAGERKAVQEAAQAYFKERYVAVAEKLSDRDPSRIEVTEVLNMARAGAQSVAFARKDEATQGAMLDEANLITFQSDLMGTDNRGLHIPAKRLVGWVRAHKEALGKSKKEPKEKRDEHSNRNKNQAFLDDLMEGITAVMTSGLVDEKLPTRINAKGSFESFAKGIPPSLRLVTSTHGAMQYGKKERLSGIVPADPVAGPPNKNDPSRDATRDDDHQTEVALDQARSEEFFVADDLEGVEPPAAYSAVQEAADPSVGTAGRRRTTAYADRPTFASGARQRKAPAMDDAGNVVRPAPYAGETSRALGTADPKTDGDGAAPLDFYPKQKPGAVPDEFADQQFRTTDKATDLAVGPEPKMSAVQQAPERAAAIVKALRKDFAAGVAMLESRLRTAQRPEYIPRPKGQKPGALDMRGAEGGVHYIFPVAHALGLDTIGSLDLGPAEAKQLQALRAETAQVILAAPKLSDARKVALTRAMAPAASVGKVTLANYAKLLHKAAGPGKAEVAATPATTPALTPAVTPAAPAPAGDAPTGLLLKALDARMEYLTNPPADYTTGKGRAIADWAQRQLDRIEERMADAPKGSELRESLADTRAQAKRLLAKAASVLEGDESLADFEGTKAAPEVAAAGAPKSRPKPSGTDRSDTGARKLNAQDGNARVATQAEMDAAKAYVAKVLGPQIKVEFKDITGYSGEWLDAEQAIHISATAAAGTLSTAYHEALHGFFSKFVKNDERVKETLKSLAENDKLLQRVAALLAKHPAALDQLKSGEERLAYIYQFWAAGKLDLPMGKPRTVLQKVRKFLRRVLGLVQDSERAVALFEAFHGGQLAQPSAAGRVIAGILDEGTGVLKARRKVDGVAQWLAAKTMPAETILATSESKAARELAKEFFTNPGDGTVGQEAEGYLNARRRMAARYNNTFAQAIQGLSDRDMTEVARYLQQEAELADIDYAPHREAVGKIRNLLQRFYRYMSDERGLKLGHAGEKYYPRVWNTALLHQKKDQFVAMLTEHYGAVLAQGAQGSKGQLSEEQVAERIWRALIDREGVNDKLDAQRQDGVLAPFFASKENRTLAWLQGEHAEPFLEKSLVGTLSRYFHQGVRAAEYTDRFGADGEHLEKRLMEVQNELVEVSHARAKRKEFKDDEARAKWAKRQYRDVAEAVGAMEGTLGKDISPGLRKLSSYTTVYQNIRLLPLSLFASFVDPLGMVARGATMREAYDGFLRGMKEVVRTWGDMFREEPKERQADQWERLAEHVGAVDVAMFDHFVSDAYSSVYMERGAKKVNDTMFKLNGMEAWNRGMRVAGTKSAVKFIERHSALPDKAHSARWLQELGLDPKNIPLDGEGNLITDKSVLISEKGMGKAQAEREIDAVHYAINRWVEGAILTPNAAQRPAWGSDPHYSVFFHLKQFSYSFHQTLIKRAVQEMNHGNLAPLGAFVWYIPAMISADIVKGLIQGGGELPTYMKAYDAGDWVMHGVQRAGVLGVGTMGVDAQADVFSLAGPAAEQMVDAMVDPLERTLLKAAPAHGLYAEAFR